MNSETLDDILNKFLPEKELNFVQKVIYGDPLVKPLNLSASVIEEAKKENIELKGYSFINEDKDSQLKPPNIVRVALFQNSIVETSTSSPIEVQRESFHKLAKNAIQIAATCRTNIFCFQEVWNAPMFFSLQKKMPWAEFAEDPYEGPTTTFLKELAKKHEMVIISPILERDKRDFIWNTAVIIDADGRVLGISRKNHIPISGKFTESYFYLPSNIGHPVFKTKYGKIGVMICFDRHHPQCAFTFALNEAEIVFIPSATVQTFSESLWPVESRALASNGFYTCAINRVGTEIFHSEGGKKDISGPFFGSSFISSPDGRRCPGLSITENALLVSDLDLNLCKKGFLKEHQNGLEKITEKFKIYLSN